jgi:hypothetical protein
MQFILQQLCMYNSLTKNFESLDGNFLEETNAFREKVAVLPLIFVLKLFLSNPLNSFYGVLWYLQKPREKYKYL